MGVNGLFPFLSKKCPEVIKELQGGLKALSGKTVVIDGTLVTQRFHFAQSTLKRRSIIGWYRLINYMTLQGVKPICVFDGKERSAAKRREVLRRRAERVLAAVRGDLEDQRLERLAKMHDTIRALKNLSDEEKTRVTRKLKSIMEPTLAPPSTVIQEPAEPQIEVEVQADPADIIGLLLSSEGQEPAARPLGQRTEQRGQPWETEKADLPVQVSDTSPPVEGTETKASIATSHIEPLLVQTLLPASDDSGPLSVPPFTPPAQPEATLPPSGNVQEDSKEGALEKEGASLETMSNTLAELYKEYQDSVATFNGVLTSSESSSVAAGDVPTFLSSTPGPSVAVESLLSGASSQEPSIVFRASKHQVELMGMESEAWTLLSSAASTSLPALWKGDAATASVLSPLPDQPVGGLSADQSLAPYTTDGEATVGLVGTTSDTANEMGSDRDEQVLSQPLESTALPTPAQFVEQAEETFHNVEQRSGAIAASYKRRINGPTDQTYREAQSLLQAMGVPVVITEGGEEAEAVASALVLEGSGDYVATEDTDVLIHGATMLRNITSHRIKDATLVTVSGLEVRRALEIPTQRAYIDFALLLGTDFTERIKNLGPAAAYKLIKEYGSIEDVIKLIQGEDVRPTTPKKAPIIAAGEQETDTGKKPKKAKRVVARKKAPSSLYTIRYPLSEYLTHVHMGREVYSTHPSTPAKELLKQKPRDEAALSSLLREWSMDRELLDGPDELLGGSSSSGGGVWRMGEGYDWESGEDGDIYRRFGGSLDWEEPWEDGPLSDDDEAVSLTAAVGKRSGRRKVSN